MMQKVNKRQKKFMIKKKKTEVVNDVEVKNEVIYNKEIKTEVVNDVEVKTEGVDIIK